MSGALAFVAGLGAGYMKQKQTNIENERQAKLDAQREQEFQWRADEHKRQTDERQAIVQASKPIAMEMGAGGMVKPDYMDNADVGQPNEGALLPGGYKVQGKSYADQATAQAEVDKQNTPQAVATRVGAAMRGAGNVQGAMNMEHAGLQIESAKDQLSKSQEQSAHDKAFRSVVTRFQKDGWAGIPAIYADYKDGHTATVQEDGKGGAVVTRIGPDGQPVGSKAFASPMDFITGQLANLDPKLYVSSVQHAEDKKQTQANSDRTFTEGVRQFDENKRIQEEQFKVNKDLQKWQIGISSAQLGLAKDEAQRKKVIFEQETKVPSVVKTAYGSLESTAKIIDQAITKAQADGSFTPENQATKDLLAKRAVISLQMSDLLSPYMDKAKGKSGEVGAAADPFNLRQPDAKPQQMPSPQSATKPVTQPIAGQVGAAGATQTTNAPVRSTDGGKTWTLEIPETVRDPSVPYYRKIPNPVFVATQGKTFASRKEAEAAFAEAAK